MCTGRSTRSGGSVRSDYDRSETIEETADGTAAHNASRYRINVHYDLVEVAVNRR